VESQALGWRAAGGSKNAGAWAGVQSGTLPRRSADRPCRRRAAPRLESRA
jgi:hypothetical protein